MNKTRPLRLLPKQRILSALVLAGVGVASFAGLTWAAGTQVYNPATRQWSDYNRSKAYQYYKRMDGSRGLSTPVVPFRTAEEPGTIIIDGNQHFLYLVQPGQQAVRYGIGVGREGFGWAGIVRVGRMAEWPTDSASGNGGTRSECGKVCRWDVGRAG